MQKNDFPSLSLNDARNMPIGTISTQNEKMEEGEIVRIVDQMLETQKKAHSAKSESDKKHYQQKIEMLDKQIDDLVYKLYGLTPEEIKVVEGEK